MSDDSPYILVIDWQGKNLPRYVGPFPTMKEATDWGDLNVVGGATARLEQLAYPYARPKTWLQGGQA